MTHIEEINGFVSQIATALKDTEQVMSGDVEIIRATKKIVFIGERFAVIDEDLVSPNSIAAIHSNLKTAKERIVAFTASSDQSLLDLFLTSLNETIQLMSSLPLLRNEDKDKVENSFSELTAQKIAALQLQISALKKAEKDFMLDLKREWAEFVDGSEEKKLTGAKKVIENEIAEMQSRIESSFVGDSDKKGWLALAEEKLNEIEGVKQRAKNLGVLIADGTTSGSYRDQARREMWASRGWRFLTLLIAFVWICTIFSTPIIIFIKPIILKSYGIELVVPSTLTGIDLLYSHFMSSLPFIAFAAWTSSVASNHRRTATRLKQFEMDLAAFEPSLENVDAANRSNAKLEFVKTTFGKNHDVIDPTTAELLKKAIEKLSEVTSKLADKIKI